jgi:hypothetical protein
MTEHLPECELTEPCEPDSPKHGFCSRQSTYCIHCERACICERLRACEERVFALHPEWTVTGLCKPDCAACRRLTELITEWEHGYEKGLDAARDAVKALPEYALRDTCIAALRESHD